MTEKSYLQKIEEHKGIILKVVNLYADCLEDRKDLYQEIVLQSWGAYARFEGNAKFSTWLYRISLNVALTFLSKSKKAAKIKENTNQDISFEPQELSERSDFLYRAIKQLAEIDRSIIILHLDGFDNLEISEITGLSKSNTSVKLHRIKQQLTTIINGK
ncbi:sigma-70 family RNA polymerase sigma factor [Pedobacter polaris]|uniref:Sigma-70 family RNA polymerase sigma factor n=1 Tax=Pedobacter polaris TaxID=2571273 RepID=A0A4U1CCP7_9SPHI|nr:sigma-70 family RNA polymerase sigma factor [Pedobacter polaris]TKC04598.1 sigma-70 family RNA polymerase sigma factor [Pedobacter polaris]